MKEGKENSNKGLGLPSRETQKKSFVPKDKENSSNSKSELKDKDKLKLGRTKEREYRDNNCYYSKSRDKKINKGKDKDSNSKKDWHISDNKKS